MESVEACKTLLGVLLAENRLVEGLVARVLEYAGDSKALSDVLVGNRTVSDELYRRV